MAVSRVDVEKAGFKQWPAYIVVGALRNQVGNSWTENELEGIILNWLDGPSVVPEPEPDPETPPQDYGVLWRTPDGVKAATGDLSAFPDGTALMKTTVNGKTSVVPGLVVTKAQVGGTDQAFRQTIDFQKGFAATDDISGGRTRVRVVDEKLLACRDGGCVGNGTADDTAAAQAVLDSLPDRGTLIFEGDRKFSVQNLRIPDRRGIKAVVDGEIKARAGGDTDYLIASQTYLDNANGGLPYVTLEVNGKVDGNGLVDKAIVWMPWRSSITGRGEITGAIGDGIHLPATSRDGTLTLTNTQVEVGIGGHNGASALAVHDNGRRNINAVHPKSTDGWLRNVVAFNAGVCNISLATAGGWHIEGVHEYNFGVTELAATTTLTATTASGSKVLTGVASVSGPLVLGHRVAGAGIPNGSEVVGVNLDGPNTLRISQNASATAAGVAITVGGTDEFGHGWGMHVGVGGVNGKIRGNIFESWAALQVRSISGDNGFSISGNVFSGSVAGAGVKKVSVSGGSGGSALVSDNTFKNGGALQVGGPGTGTGRAFVAHSTNNAFFIPQPYSLNNAPSVIVASNDHINDFGTPGVPADKLITGAQDGATTSAVGTARRSAAPTSASERWEVGDRVTNSAPTAGGPRGWICITAGNPGVWVADGPSANSVTAGSTPFAETMSRDMAGTNTSQSTSNGQVDLTYFTAEAPVAVSKIGFTVRGTALAGASLARVGLYLVDPSTGSLALVARSASDAAKFAATFTDYDWTLDTTGGYPASYTLVPGSRYAVGVIVVGASTQAALYGVSAPRAGVSPVIARRFSGQTDLPASIAAGSLQSSSNRYYALLFT